MFVDDIETIDLLLQLLETVGEGLPVEKPEQRLVEAFILAPRRGLKGLAGDRPHPEEGDIGNELTEDWIPPVCPETLILGKDGVMSSNTSRTYPQELRERAVRMVV